jgi:N-acetylglucosaminyldiphosphoundecaprenol N-acetyl-beta-D-mannosaminyltransferase
MNPTLAKSKPHTRWNQVSLLGVKIDALTLNQLLSEMHSCILHEDRVMLSYVNIHAINIAFSTPWFRNFLNESYLTFCDGVGIKVAARLTGQRLSDRFTPPDFMYQICRDAAAYGWRLFFLGARPGVAQRAADKLVTAFPGLQIMTHHGYFNKDQDSLENRAVIDMIDQFRPHILVLGFGMPLQEKWISENMSSLQINIAFPAGALFDYLSGEVWRAPRWMTDHGLEWLGRLVIEPGRLWKRYLIGNPLFLWRIMIHNWLGHPLPE